MTLLRSVRTIFAAYEACAVDVYRAFRGSWFIGLLLAAFYLLAFAMGLAIGAIAYEALEPLLFVVGFGLPFPYDIILELSVLIILLYAATSLCCLLARVLVKGATYLLYELRGDVLFYLMLIGALGSVLLLTVSSVLPPLVPENFLVAASGVSAFAALLTGIATAWLFFRYRWTLHPRGREYDRDIGLAWSHMSDPRRARFGFGWRSK